MSYLDEPDFTIGEIIPESCGCTEPCDCDKPRPPKEEKRGEELPFCPDCHEPDGLHLPDCPNAIRDVGF
jgi:hypothetical protein